MGLRSFFGKVLNRLKLRTLKAPPVARRIPEATIIREAAFAPPVAKLAFKPKIAQIITRKAPLPPTAKVVPEAKVGKARKMLKRQEVGGRAKFVNPYGLKAAIQEYLYWGEWLPVRSSNVMQIKYDQDKQMLYVKFINHGAEYEYPGIDIDLAYTFAVSLSKGKWVWENLRNAFRAYRFRSSDDGHVPKRQMELDIEGRRVGTGKYVFSKKAEARVAKRMRRTLFHEATMRRG